jgi:hypothetical protein
MAMDFVTLYEVNQVKNYTSFEKLGFFLFVKLNIFVTCAAEVCYLEIKTSLRKIKTNI